MEKSSKLVDKRFEKIIDEKAYYSVFERKIYDIYFKYGNILKKEALSELYEFFGEKSVDGKSFNIKKISKNILIWETDKVYVDKPKTIYNVWVNEEYEGFPRIIPTADIETYCAKTGCPVYDVTDLLTSRNYRKYGKARPYIYHQSRLHYFKSIGEAAEWVADDIYEKTKENISIDVAKTKISEIINTTNNSKIKRYRYKGYIARKI